MTQKLVFIGGGNMAVSLIGGLRRAGADVSVTVVEPDRGKHEQLAETCDVTCVAEPTSATLNADAVVLAVKPQSLPQVAPTLAPLLGDSQAVIVSIAAGVPLSALEYWFGGARPIVRCMPNTPALIGAGITGLYAPSSVGADGRRIADMILAAAGETVWVDSEEQLTAVTAVSGSGPAYFFAFIEALQSAGESQGLDTETARLLAGQTALGAARMVAESEDDAATLRANVTSPGGTTEKALYALTDAGLEQAVSGAVRSAAVRAGELADDLDPS